jgi:hypothetical protein
MIRLVALALGAWAVILLTRAAGTSDFAEAFSLVAPAIGILGLLELARVACEITATSTQLGRYVRPLGIALLVKGHLLSYATSNLAPAGRPAGEVLKAAAFAPMLGKPMAAAMAVRIQAASLYAGGAMSAACSAAAILARAPSWLSMALVVHTAFAWGTAALLMRAGRWGGATKTASRLRVSLAMVEEGMRAFGPSTAGATVFLFLGRSIQVAQMAVVLAVLTRATTLQDSLLMQGLFMVGTALGDLIPGQIGATDAAFSMGASSFSATAGQGLAVAVAMHLVQLSMAALCSLLALWPARKKPGHVLQEPSLEARVQA